jgi:uncharacterized protein YndB with AHSA1/START domain
MSSRVLVSLRVAATPQRAFDVFTRDIHLWWQSDGLFRFSRKPPGKLAFEPKLGGALTETYADGSQFEIGRVTAWEPGAKLGFTWRQASFTPEQGTDVEVRFEAVGAETRVSVEHRGWDSVPPEHVARHRFPDGIFLQRHGEYWQRLLLSLRQWLAAP